MTLVYVAAGKNTKKCCLGNERVPQQENRGEKQQMLEKTPLSFPGKDITLTTSKELGIESMSDIIIDFAEDMLKQSDTIEAQKMAIMVAISA